MKSDSYHGDYYLTGDRVDPEKLVVIRPGRGYCFDTDGKRHDLFYCMDCLMLAPACFAVNNAVWHESKLTRGYICIDCFQKRLGRLLALSDFKGDACCNQLIFWAWKAAKLRA